MRIVKNPRKETWAELAARPTLDTRYLERTVKNILDDVRTRGDAALRYFARHFDKANLDGFLVTEDEYQIARSAVSDRLKDAIGIAKGNIEKFHAVAAELREVVETTPGVYCWQKSVAIEKAGLYIPAGSAPLFSTVLMLAIPARLAGCGEIVVTSPPNRDGEIDPSILYAAEVCGVTSVYKIGGAQAVAALAYGTETVPRVYKIFGPGNQFVTEAKLQVMRSGVAVDMPAGPSELAVLVDETCVPAFVAADLLSQAEHGPDSQVVLISTSETLTDEILTELRSQLEGVSRKAVAEAAIENSLAVVVSSLDEGMDFANAYAPEHLILAAGDAESLAEKVVNAGSVFIGNYSTESVGDYAAGTNHTLPTGGSARAYSGVSVASFCKTISFQRLTKQGLENIGDAVETMAGAEGLDAHRNAVAIRRRR